MFKTIQEAEHYIRTVFGDSSITINERAIAKLHQGILQENGLEPVTQALTNTPMVDIHRKKEFGVKFAMVISKISDQVIGFIFVDDTDLNEGNLRSRTKTFEEVAEKIQ